MKSINFLLSFICILAFSFSSHAEQGDHEEETGIIQGEYKPLKIVLEPAVSHSSSEEETDSSPTASSPPKQGCMVFLDTSLSMRGYFKTTNREASTIQQFLQTEFRNFLSENDLYPIYFSGFGDEVTAPHQMQDNDNIGDRFIYKSDTELKSLFSSGNSDITRIFRGEELSRYSASIIITDGVQDATDGFDIGKMIKAIRRKKDEGLQIYLLGLEAEFDGFVFPVLTAQPAPFWHNGKRPIYIWIITHDTEKGNDLKDSMAERVRKYTKGHEMVSLTDLQKPDANLETNKISPYYILIPRKREELLEVRLVNSLRKMKNINDINIPILNKYDMSRNSGYHKLKLELESEINWVKIEEDEDGSNWTISLVYDKIPHKNNNLKIMVTAIPDTEKWWWRQWSIDAADNSRKNAGKTLYLKRLGERIIEPSYKNEHKLGYMNLKINK